MPIPPPLLGRPRPPATAKPRVRDNQSPLGPSQANSLSAGVSQPRALRCSAVATAATTPPPPQSTPCSHVVDLFSDSVGPCCTTSWQRRLWTTRCPVDRIVEIVQGHVDIAPTRRGGSFPWSATRPRRSGAEQQPLSFRMWTWCDHSTPYDQLIVYVHPCAGSQVNSQCLRVYERIPFSWSCGNENSVRNQVRRLFVDCWLLDRSRLGREYE